MGVTEFKSRLDYADGLDEHAAMCLKGARDKLKNDFLECQMPLASPMEFLRTYPVQ
jgi:hypothetical protein